MAGNPEIAKLASSVTMFKQFWEKNEISTAISFVRHNGNDLLSRFRLACWYCLEDDIVALYRPYEFVDANRLNDVDFLTRYWLHYLTNTLRELKVDQQKWSLIGIPTPLVSEQEKPPLTLHVYGVFYSVKRSNLASLRYFWSKLDGTWQNHLTERLCLAISSEFHLGETDPNIVFFVLNEIDAAFFSTFGATYIPLLLPLVTFDQKTVLFHHDQILNLTKKFRPFVSAPMYFQILYRTISNDCNEISLKLFRLFWNNAPDNFKSYFLHNDQLQLLMQLSIDYCCSSVATFLWLQVKENQRDAKLIDFCHHLIRLGKWDILEPFLPLFVTSSLALDKFRVEMDSSVHHLFPGRLELWMRSIERNRLHEFLDKSFNFSSSKEIVDALHFSLAHCDL